MFSGSVARGSRQLLSQMNDHYRMAGNQNAGQNPAYDLLYCLYQPIVVPIRVNIKEIYLYAVIFDYRR